MREELFLQELRELRLSKAERSTLVQAAAILGKIRELRDDADDDQTTDIALAAHVCQEVAAEETLPL